jgi:hypothetical protein
MTGSPETMSRSEHRTNEKRSGLKPSLVRLFAHAAHYLNTVSHPGMKTKINAFRPVY